MRTRHRVAWVSSHSWFPVFICLLSSGIPDQKITFPIFPGFIRIILAAAAARSNARLDRINNVAFFHSESFSIYSRTHHSFLFSSMPQSLCALSNSSKYGFLYFVSRRAAHTLSAKGVPYSRRIRDIAGSSQWGEWCLNVSAITIG